MWEQQHVWAWLDNPLSYRSLYTKRIPSRPSLILCQHPQGPFWYKVGLAKWNYPYYLQIPYQIRFHISRSQTPFKLPHTTRRKMVGVFYSLPTRGAFLSYRVRIGLIPSSLCPFSGGEPHTCIRIISCPSHPIPLTERDLWSGLPFFICHLFLPFSLNPLLMSKGVSG